MAVPWVCFVRGSDDLPQKKEEKKGRLDLELTRSGNCCLNGDSGELHKKQKKKTNQSSSDPGLVRVRTTLGHRFAYDTAAFDPYILIHIPIGPDLT